MALFKSSSEFCDAISIIAYCHSDSSYMFIQDSPSTEYWIPSAKVTAFGTSINKQIMRDILELFGETFECDSLLKVYKFWLPNTQGNIMHYIFGVKVDADQKRRSRQSLGRFRGRIVWKPDVELFRIFSLNALRSPEIFEIINNWKNKNLNNTAEVFKGDGIQQTGMFVEMSENVMVNSATNSNEQLVLFVSFNKNMQALIYKEFILICFPSFFMGLQGFSKFFSSLGWARSDQGDLFRAADIQLRNGVSYREFLYIVAATEPTLEPPSGNAGEARARYIFRFYDKDNDSLLRQEELKSLLLSIRKQMKQSTDPSTIHKDLCDCYKAMQIGEGTPISAQLFIKAVLEGRIKNISTIFRSAININSYLKEANERESRYMQSETRKTKGRVSSVATDGQLLKFGSAKSSANIKYEIANHAVKISTTGTMDIEKLEALDAITSSSTERPILDEIKYKGSVDQFSQNSMTNELVKTLRYMNLLEKQHKIQKKNAPFSWGSIDGALFAKRLITVCKMIIELLKTEPRLLTIASPAYVLGDFHGNFNDLLQFESVLWNVGPVLCPCNILFLGDYVDRGSASIEVITYLFCYKLQTPDKIKMLRGNHEIREIQKMFTFYDECLYKFGDRLGAEVWSAINGAFDYLPIAAIVDNSIFCCHGGIPPPWLCPVISSINNIPTPLSQPDEQSALAWEIMWNDPIRGNENAHDLEVSANEGFASNKRRGTAHTFTVEALERFLRSNGLTHVIRAHEVSRAGFNVLHKGKLISIFSSSKYCGGINDAACVMIDQGRIRFVRIETD